jgi:hypothetical protein
MVLLMTVTLLMGCNIKEPVAKQQQQQRRQQYM